jgi:hypothetical protein
MAVEVNSGRPLLWHDRAFHTLTGARSLPADD